MREHHYTVAVEWTGNRGPGTSDYTSFSRDHRITAPGRPAIEGSSDPHFRGDASRYNPEDLLVASLSACHMLWYLHLCAVEGVRVLAYDDDAAGRMTSHRDGGQFVEVVLRPRVVIAPGDSADTAAALHAKAHASCFVASSVSFPVRHEPTIVVADEGSPATG